MISKITVFAICFAGTFCCYPWLPDQESLSHSLKYPKQAMEILLPVSQSFVDALYHFAVWIQNVLGLHLREVPPTANELVLQLYGSRVDSQISEAETVLESLDFSEYSEHSICDIKTGVPLERYRWTVETISDFLKVPNALKDMFTKAGKFENGETSHLEHFRYRTGSTFHFGAFAVVSTRTGHVDVAYAIHSVKLVLLVQRPEIDALNELMRLSDREIDQDLSSLLAQYFLYKAVEMFKKYCIGMDKVLLGTK